MALLAEAQQQAVEVGRKVGVALAVSGVPEAKLIRDNECRLCHLSPPEGTVQFAGKSFPHGAHARAVEQCTACHTPRADHGKTTLNPEDCARCHGGVGMPHPGDWVESHPEFTRTHGVEACEKCHAGGMRGEFCGSCHG
jgi:hypothetical protein